jgi:WD40 repeat protein
MPLTALPSDDLVLDLAACNSIRGVLEGALERGDAVSLRGALAQLAAADAAGRIDELRESRLAKVVKKRVARHDDPQIASAARQLVAHWFALFNIPDVLKFRGHVPRAPAPVSNLPATFFNETNGFPTDTLSLILTQLCFVRNIKGVKRVCKAFRDAAPAAEKDQDRRRRSGEYEHDDPVSCVAAAPDGRIITGSNGEVKVWRDGACGRAIQAHATWVMAVAVLPGGARFVSVSKDGTAKLWTIDGDHKRTYEMGGSVNCVAALPDGAHFVVGLGRGEVRLHTVDGALVNTFTGHFTRGVTAVAVTPQPTADSGWAPVTQPWHIISGSADTLVRAEVLRRNHLHGATCNGHTSEVRAVAAMPDGQRFLSGSTDKTVRVWLLNGTLNDTFRHLHAKWVNALVALPDNQHALSGSDDKTVKLFDVDDGAVLRTFTHHKDVVTSLALLPNGLRFISGSDDNTARIVEIW